MLELLLQRSGLERFAAVDLETTGLERDCEIIEIGIAVYEGGELKESFSELVRPDQEFPVRIQKLTGIKPRDLKKARSLKEVLPEALELLGDLPLVAHNLDFDKGFLERKAAQLGLHWDASPRSLDTVVMGRILLPNLPGHRLADLRRHFEIKHDHAHRAFDDARVAGDVLLKLLRIALGLDLPLARDLQSLCHGSGDSREAVFREVVEILKENPGPGDWKEFQRPSRSHVYQTGPGARDQQPAAFDSSEWFGEEGRLKQALEDFRPRMAQQEMAAAVWETFSDNGQEQGPASLSVEAATGTGKSFAYLLPAMLQGIRSRNAETGPVLLSTYTRNLQDQLFEQDIPRLGSMLEQGVKAVLLKGRGNYLCGKRLRTLLEEAPRRLSVRDRLELMPLVTWSELTRNGDIEECTGFRSRYLPSLWQAVRSERSSCRGASCRQSASEAGPECCWAGRARRESQDAHLVVVNHSLLLSDLGVDHGVLGQYQSLVLDEAHHLPKAAESQLKVQFSAQQLENRLRQVYDPGNQGRGHLRRLLDKLGGRKAEGSAELFALLEHAARDIRDLLPGVEVLRNSLNQFLMERHKEAWQGRRYTKKDRIRGDNHPMRSLHAESATCLQGLGAVMKSLLAFAESWRNMVQDPDQVSDLEALLDHLGVDLQELRLLVEENWQDDSVVWSELHPGTEECSFHRVELDPGKRLAEICWKELKHLVLCSATMRVDDRFDYLHGRIGLDLLDPPPRELTFNSPFRMEQQAKCYIPGWMPEASGHNLRAFTEELASLLETLALRYQRGTLVLFTSYGMLNTCYKALLERLDTKKIPLFGQGLDGSRHELLERFKQEKGAILLGTDSFWQGVDLPGEALQILVMTKLPFDVPGEPLLEARGERLRQQGGHPFGDMSVPDAIIRFRQGFGRLIRHEQDRGVFLLLDHRVIHKSYGRRFLDALPLKHQGLFREEDLLKRLDSMFREKS